MYLRMGGVRIGPGFGKVFMMMMTTMMVGVLARCFRCVRLSLQCGNDSAGPRLATAPHYYFPTSKWCDCACTSTWNHDNHEYPHMTTVQTRWGDTSTTSPPSWAGNADYRTSELQCRSNTFYLRLRRRNLINNPPAALNTNTCKVSKSIYTRTKIPSVAPKSKLFSAATGTLK